MRYEKPEVLKIANAVNAIESNLKNVFPIADTESDGVYQTNGAYEADE